MYYFDFFMVDYDDLAQKYLQHRRVHPQVLKALVKISGIKKKSRVLEIGCGTGTYSIALQQQVPVECWAIDPSEKMLEQTNDQTTTITFQQGRAETLNFEDNFFDFIFSVDVIHHLDDIIPYFTEGFRALKPNGKLCTVTDSEEIIQNRRPLAFYFPETIEVDLKRYPSIYVLRHRMQQAGFRNIQQHQVEFPSEVTDIQAYQDKIFSCLHLISPESFQKGLTRMEQDLQEGPIKGNSRYSLIWGTKKARVVFV